MNIWFDVVVYTAGTAEYGNAVCDNLDRGRRIFKKRFFRQVCFIRKIAG